MMDDAGGTAYCIFANRIYVTYAAPPFMRLFILFPPSLDFLEQRFSSQTPPPSATVAIAQIYGIYTDRLGLGIHS